MSDPATWAEAREVTRKLAAQRHADAVGLWQQSLERIRYRRATWQTVLDDPDIRGVIEALDGWASDPSCDVLLVGPVGVGKTHVAFAAFGEAVRRTGRRAAWVSTLDFMGAQREHSDVSASEMQRVLGADLLLLDDVTAERWTGWGRTCLLRLIDHRYAAEKPTVVTANASDASDADRLAADLTEAIGQRNYDRLREDALILKLSGPSRRGGRR